MPDPVKTRQKTHFIQKLGGVYSHITPCRHKTSDDDA